MVERASKLAQAQRQIDGDSDGSTIPTGGSTRANRVLRAMDAFVRENLHRQIGLGQIAAHLRMNASYLSALFSKHLGMTFREYLLELRMARARVLLSEPNSRVCEVATATGFSSADHFRHAFKSHSGVPPSRWR